MADSKRFSIQHLILSLSLSRVGHFRALLGSALSEPQFPHHVRHLLPSLHGNSPNETPGIVVRLNLQIESLRLDSQSADVSRGGRCSETILCAPLHAHRSLDRTCAMSPRLTTSVCGGGGGTSTHLSPSRSQPKWSSPVAALPSTLRARSST